MDLFNEIELQDCPVCGGPALLQEENGWCWYVDCADCGCHTAEVDYTGEEQRADAARQAAYLWNIGKVISYNPGE